MFNQLWIKGRKRDVTYLLETPEGRQVMIDDKIPPRSDDPIASEKIQVDKKIFFLDLKENQRGRFLKITEDVSGRRDTIMLPASGFQEFLDALSRILEIDQRLQP